MKPRPKYKYMRGFKALVVSGEPLQILNDLLKNASYEDRDVLPNEYQEDINARVIFDTISNTTYLPGSRYQLQQQQSGVPIGAVYYRNPVIKSEKRTIGGLFQVGGHQYATTIEKGLKSKLNIPMDQIHNLIRVGFQYGLRKAFIEDGIELKGKEIKLDQYKGQLNAVKRLHDQYKAAFSIHTGPKIEPKETSECSTTSSSNNVKEEVKQVRIPWTPPLIKDKQPISSNSGNSIIIRKPPSLAALINPKPLLSRNQNSKRQEEPFIPGPHRRSDFGILPFQRATNNNSSLYPSRSRHQVTTEPFFSLPPNQSRVRYD